LRSVTESSHPSVDELKQAFKDPVDDYLEFCASRGEVHRESMTEAQREGRSLNAHVLEKLQPKSASAA
jgi:predicted HicB family RNase H-like nuclease